MTDPEKKTIHKKRCWEFVITAGKAVTVDDLMQGFQKRYTAVQSMILSIKRNGEWLQVQDGGTLLSVNTEILLRVQFNGPQPSEGPQALLTELLRPVSIAVSHVDLPKGRKVGQSGAGTGNKRARGYENGNGIGPTQEEDDNEDPADSRPYDGLLSLANQAQALDAGDSAAGPGGRPPLYPGGSAGSFSAFMQFNTSQSSISSTDWPQVTAPGQPLPSVAAPEAFGQERMPSSFLKSNSLLKTSSTFGSGPVEDAPVRPYPQRCDMEGLPASKGCIFFSEELTAHVIQEGAPSATQVFVQFGVDGNHWTSRSAGQLQTKADGVSWVPVEFPSMLEIFPMIHSVTNIRVVYVDVVVQVQVRRSLPGGGVEDTQPLCFASPQLSIEYVRFLGEDGRLPERGRSGRQRSRTPLVDNEVAPMASYGCFNPCAEFFGDIWSAFGSQQDPQMNAGIQQPMEL